MKRILAALVCGLLFGIGLSLAQMINPQKVLNFLDLAAAWSGGWDPSLAFVLAGAIVTTAAGYRLAFRRNRPLLAESFSLPTGRRIDARLIVGATVFGAGWGLVGFCPGPALAALGPGWPPAAVFVLAMLAGMAVFRLLFERRRPLGPPRIAAGHRSPPIGLTGSHRP